ncbi:L-2-hydroxyglutarate oxidase [Agromyces cerinus]|uniref:L-2-hydroxyglutarate oxidase n=1 Tax=Agromyces cerinus subsp. cerinus TaxID=232089 RepID=A0A1N6F6R4_9MICO|nr:L-2-hydroxyglutarate oxidase [Agromyces cerinus]SIN90947.1 L-2-hydroxyglutarate oxidase [Agromyces cerinus subsp. cerinus]
MDDLIIIGAGIVGLATARAVLEREPRTRITIVEKADAVATGQTGHNSGVVHAGLYYEPGSLKSELCRAGRLATIEFCEENAVPLGRVGKLVVATDERERARLDALADRSVANGIDIERIDAAEISRREPNIRGVQAVFSPGTSIVDFGLVARTMQARLEAAGVRLVFGADVRSIDEHGSAGAGEVRVRTADGAEYRARRLVACAGLQADRIARLGGLPVDFRIIPFRGEYFELVGQASLVRHLIYPVPDPSMPFLGVHLSPTIDGRITVGPNAVLGFARERYPRGAISAADMFDYLRFPGFWRMAFRHRRAAAIEARNSMFRRSYLAACRRYAPGLRLEDLGRRFAGVRAQAVRPDGSLVEDFLFERTARQLHVCNAPSPAATSAIPIGRLIAGQFAVGAR